MINFKREYIGLEQDRLLYPVSFKDKAKCNVYGRKKFITEAGEVQLSAHVFLISKDFWTFNAGQLDFTNYPNGIWNDYISIDIVEKDEYTAPSINFGSMGDITPENLQGLSDYISKHLSDLEKRIVEDYLFIDEGVSENIELPNLPENHFWARRNGVIVGVNLDYLKADYEHFKNELWKNYESFNEKLQAALKKYYDDLELQMNNFFKDLIEKIREEAEKQLGLIAGAGGGLLHKIGQANHGFIFDPIVYENGVWKKATTTSGVDGIGVVISANTFFFLEAGEIEIPKGATDKDGQPLLDDEYYYMNEDGGTGFQKEEPVWFYQPLFHTRTYKGKLLANVHIDTMEDLRGQVVDTESGRTYGIALWGDIVPKFDTIEKLQKAFWLKEGEVVEVLGYYSPGDGANHKRIIKAEDDGSGVQLSNNLWANIVHNGEVNVSWFGCIKNTYSDTEIEKLFNYVKNKKNNIYLVIVDGYVKIKKPVNLTDCNNIKIKGKFARRYSSFNGLSNLNGFELSEEAYFDCIDSFCMTFEDLFFNHIGENLSAPPQTILFGRSTDQTVMGERVLNCEFRGHIKNYNIIFAGAEVNTVSDCIAVTGGLAKGIIGIFTENKGIFSAFKTLQQDLVSCSCNNFYNNSFEFYSTVDGSAAYHFNTGDTNTTIQGGYFYSMQVKSSVLRIDLYNNAGNLNLTLRGMRCEGERREILKVNNFAKKEIFITSLTIENNYFTIPKGNYYLIDIPDDVKLYSFSYSGNTTGEWFPVLEKNLLLNIPILIYSRIITSDNSILKSKSIIGSNIILGKESQFLKEILKDYKPYDKFHNFRGSYIQNGSSANTFILGQGVKDIVFKTGNYMQRPTISQPFIDLEDAQVFLKQEDHKVIFYSKKDKIWYYADGTVAYNESETKVSANVTQLNTLYHAEKMKQEGVYEDYISYMDEKTAYDKQQRKLEQDRQLAYEEALKENPELTYEEFMSLQPMTLNLVEEPQPSQALKDFMDKYL